MKHKVDLVSVGNGTASRETDKLVAELIAKMPNLKLTKAMVSEAGASVYSASELAAKEFPDLDVTLRGAVSIARRLQDPLAELVKIEPKAIGVGQYQHDVDQAGLARSLDAVVEDCVNSVGVDVNTASAPLLARVSGLNQTLAANIVAFRDENGAFKTRTALKKVPRLGPKTFEQAAGFLRIMNGKNPLDASAVHPEAYPVVEKISEATQAAPEVHHRRPGVPAIAEARGVRGRAVRHPDRHRHPGRAGEARPRPAPRVQDRHLPGGRREDLGPEAAACSSRASSPTSRPSAPSSTSACTRTGSCTSPSCPTASSRTRARW